jgi:hypothetical protein
MKVSNMDDSIPFLTALTGCTSVRLAADGLANPPALGTLAPGDPGCSVGATILVSSHIIVLDCHHDD